MGIFDMWGHTYKVDSQGSIYKNGRLIGEKDYKYLPSKVVQSKNKSMFSSNNSRLSNDVDDDWIIGTRKGNSTGAFIPVMGENAKKVNPLYDVNERRQELNVRGSKQERLTFNKSQTPLWYDKDQNGQTTRNKKYYANLLTGYAMEYTGGDDDRIEQLIQDYKNAPGALQYIPKINSSEYWANKWGVKTVDNSYFNSKENNPFTLRNGYEKPRNWYDNPFFSSSEQGQQELKETIKANVTGSIGAGSAVGNNPFKGFFDRFKEINKNAPVFNYDNEKGKLVEVITEQPKTQPTQPIKRNPIIDNTPEGNAPGNAPVANVAMGNSGEVEQYVKIGGIALGVVFVLSLIK